MTKHDNVDTLTYNHGLQRSSATKAVNGMLEAIITALNKGQDVTLRGFGTIKVYNAPQRTARDINANKTIIVPPRRTVKLKPSKELIQELNSSSPYDA